MDNVIRNEAKFDLTNPNTEVLSQRDPQYAIHFFADSLRGKLAKANSFVEEVYTTVLKEASTTSQIVKSFENGSRFVVDMSDSTKKAIDKGQIKMVTEHGKLRAQLRDENGHYGSKLDIKEEFYNKGIDPVQLANALQLKALQEQLQTVTDQIVIINSNVLDVLQGQQNDRIALFYSGIALFSEAQSIKNPEMKSALMAQAIRALSDGTQQLILTMESDIEFLTSRQYDKFRGKKLETIQNKMESINKAFGFIHQATLARAAIYCEQEEYLAMANVLEEYSRFIESTIISNANFLSQCDPNDNGTDIGIWNSRAKLKLDASELRRCFISDNQEYYLSIEGDVNEN